MKKQKTKQILTAGVLSWLATSAIGWLTCGWLFSWVYELPPTDFWLPMEQMNMPMMTIMGLLMALFFAWVYSVIKNGIPGEGVKKGITFGFLMWLIGPLFGIGMMAFYMQIATGVVIYWIVQALVMNIVSGAILGKFIN